MRSCKTCIFRSILQGLYPSIPVWLHQHRRKAIRPEVFTVIFLLSVAPALCIFAPVEGVGVVANVMPLMSFCHFLVRSRTNVGLKRAEGQGTALQRGQLLGVKQG